jgi:hypothetical protein
MRSASGTSPSPRLLRALKAERAALKERLRALERERARLRALLNQAEAEIQAVDERLVLLDRLEGEPGTVTDRSLPSDEADRRLLAGPAIRATAVGVLRTRPEGDSPIHYRRWLQLVEQAGYEVCGQKPAATFLSQITRSPVVRRTTRSGYYELDRHAPAVIRRRIAGLRTQLGTVSAPQDEPIDLEEVRQRRSELLREIERAERRLDEATAALTLPVAQLARIA